MDSDIKKKLDQLAWAVGSRAKNQKAALRLLMLFRQHENTWKSKKYSRAAQELLAVCFSLWRAAFLADKKSKREEVLADAVEFLETVVEDNAISYPQDKKSREWTFNYYTRNARAALEALARQWPDTVVPKYQSEKRTPQERWDYCQELLDKGIAGFEKWIEDREAAVVKKRTRSAVRANRRSNRRKVRALILEQRKKKV